MIELIIENLSVNIGNKKIIDSISTTFKTKELVLLLGRNGSGKSTFLKALAGLTKYSGKIFTSTNEKHYLVTGYIFQNPETQIIGSTVWEDVIFGLENIGLARDEIKKRAEKALKIVGLYKFKDLDPYVLSGGQKQKLAIASILSMEPYFLLLDEPTAMLDKHDRKIIKILIKELKKLNIGVILATHHSNFFFDIADRIIFLSNGKIVFDGKTNNYTELIGKLFSKEGDVFGFNLSH
ncbi:energy-coupling factor transport system ATP-binding protein [Thermosipho atlanticus DSM 15807]|uniref:Energy-coupling factor transport system ATP-binding protein n=1 Tax=Thermosipho atlanticus DSM 15807 TaxID=1123380 RepID=A0A1M5SGE3_9BACT|nr:energy-coupling factor transport system ATP-binding protein [Thermosipho atlanticus DSM 15807]